MREFQIPFQDHDIPNTPKVENFTRSRPSDGDTAIHLVKTHILGVAECTDIMNLACQCLAHKLLKDFGFQFDTTHKLITCTNCSRTAMKSSPGIGGVALSPSEATAHLNKSSQTKNRSI